MKHKSIANKIIELKNADLKLRNRLIQNGQLGKGYNEEMQDLYQSMFKSCIKLDSDFFLGQGIFSRHPLGWL